MLAKQQGRSVLLYQKQEPNITAYLGQN